MILAFILNNCHVRQNSVVKVDDYYSDENSYVESEEENQQYEQKIFNRDFKSLTFKSNSLILGELLLLFKFSKRSNDRF